MFKNIKLQKKDYALILSVIALLFSIISFMFNTNVKVSKNTHNELIDDEPIIDDESIIDDSVWMNSSRPFYDAVRTLKDFTGIFYLGVMVWVLAFIWKLLGDT